jgi:hypothetical protein
VTSPQDHGSSYGHREHAPPLTGGPGARTRWLCHVCVDQLPIDGAAITLGDEVHAQLLHATDPVVAALVDLQLVLGEGPGPDSYRHRLPMMEPDLAGMAALSTWPGFAREATQIGAAAVFAFPLHVGAVPFGILHLYSRTARPFSPTELASAILLTDRAIEVVLQDFADTQAPDASLHDVDVLLGGTQVAQATGMVAVQLRISVSQALAYLRATAFAQNRPLGAVAGDVLDAGRQGEIARERGEPG